MRASGSMEIVAGRVRELIDTGSALEVHYVPRRGAAAAVVSAALVVNSIGPETDYERIDQPLVKNLLGRGLIRPGPANIGIDALPNGAIVGRDGVPSDVLYTLGTPMKGIVWEVLAVIELRVQAERLVRLFLEREGQRPASAFAAETEA